MDIFAPACYSHFRCIANKCPDSCCKEWTVDVDPKSARFYRSLNGDLGARLREVLKDTKDGTIMEIENGRCPMWQSDGLCRIQAQLGHDALCKTCRDFPRLRHDYGSFVELGLELSCPEAARLILSEDSRLVLLSSTPETPAPEYAPDIMDTLRQSRSAVLSFLEDTQIPLQKALAAMLLYAYDVQAVLDGAEQPLPSVGDCLEEAEDLSCLGDISSVFSFFAGLEILTDTWKNRLLQPPVSAKWSPELRAFVRYMIQRYWLQAVSDYDLVCRVKLILVSCILVRALGGDIVSTAQLFSKEIENDPDNVETILDGAYTCPALTDANLLGLLLA